VLSGTSRGGKRVPGCLPAADHGLIWPR
jgi:hypothetical protein